MTSWTNSEQVDWNGPWGWSRLDRSQTHTLLRSLGGKPPRNLTGALIAFCRVLRRVLPGITSGRIIDACESLRHIDLTRQEDFCAALKANLISAREDEATFDLFFQMFWDPPDEQSTPPYPGQTERRFELPSTEEDPAPPKRAEDQLRELLFEEWEGEGQEAPESQDTPSYSPFEVLSTKDFSSFTHEEERVIRRIIAKLVPKLATMPSRRRRPHAKGRETDLRRTFRTNLRHGGEILKLARRRHKRKKLRIALLCDVSGSMDAYSKFLVQFIYSVENELSAVDAWVFSTRLSEVTPLLRGRSFEESLERLAQEVHDWSGGTVIGQCLREFSTGPSRAKVNSRTIVIIISDGWDRGDTELLANEMRYLKRRTHKIIWLNPLLGSPNYQPLCAGIRAALPYTDYFLPAHNLDSLIQLGKTLSTLGNGRLA